MSQSNQASDTKKATSTVTSSTVPSDAGAYLASFECVEAEIRAIPEDGLKVVNIDVPTSVTTVVGAMAEILKLRDAIARLDDFDIRLVDKLQDYAQACGHAHGLYRIATGRRTPPPSSVKKSRPLATSSSPTLSS